MKIYMDVCCLCRPFDDFTSPDGKRIRQEAEAVETIFKLAKSKDWTILLSTIIEDEVSNLSNPKKANGATTFYPLMNKCDTLVHNIGDRATYFQTHGARNHDSLHLSLAESAADVFLTTDDTLLKIATNADTRIEVENPLAWLKKEIAWTPEP